jgi:hypothetical protein
MFNRGDGRFYLQKAVDALSSVWEPACPDGSVNEGEIRDAARLAIIAIACELIETNEILRRIEADLDVISQWTPS